MIIIYQHDYYTKIILSSFRSFARTVWAVTIYRLVRYYVLASVVPTIISRHNEIVRQTRGAWSYTSWKVWTFKTERERRRRRRGFYSHESPRVLFLWTDRPCRMKYRHFWSIVWFKSPGKAYENFDLWRINGKSARLSEKRVSYRHSLTLYTRAMIHGNAFRFNLISHKISDDRIILYAV